MAGKLDVDRLTQGVPVVDGLSLGLRGMMDVASQGFG